jgi:hypothetical protein
MSIIAMQMGEHIKNTIATVTKPVFDKLGIQFTAEQVWNDLARINGGQLKATFYVAGLDNVVRKEFNAVATELKQSDATVKEFKVKFKRPEKEVRFYLEIDNTPTKEQTNESEDVSI